MFTLEEFVRESNRIEDITWRFPAEDEMKAHETFLDLPEITEADLTAFVNVVAPHAVLRDKPGLGVRVGEHRPPPGGPEVAVELDHLLDWANSTVIYSHEAYKLHLRYENLHPYTDGNGRSGRVLWLWMKGGIDKAPLGFLHQFYYDTLAATQ